MSGISSADAVTNTETDLIGTLENPVPAAPFAPLCTEKLDALRKLADIFQVQIIEKTKLEKLKLRSKYWNKSKTGPRHLQRWSLNQ